MAGVRRYIFLFIVVQLCSFTFTFDLSVISNWETQNFETCNVLDWGAKGNGFHDDTTSIRNALENCQSTNATFIIIFPTNYLFLTGAFNISSNQILYLEEGSTILGIKDDDSFHYPLVDPLPSYPISTGKNSAPRYQGFISSYNATNIGIIGSGIINGHGEWWWKKYDSGELTMTRPRLIELCYSNTIVISGVKMERSAFWCLHLYSSENIFIYNTTIDNPLGSPNTDGIDIDSSSNCLIDNVNIRVADDHISIKSGQSSEGFYYNKSSENIIIQNSYFGIGAGLAIGSETSGGVSNVTYVNNTMTLTGNGPRMKTCPHYGYPVHNIEWNGLHLDGADQVVFVDSNYECSNPDDSIPSGGFHDIRFKNITGFGLQAGSLQCFEGGCTNFLFDNVDIVSIIGFRCSNITGEEINTSPPMCFDNTSFK